MIKNIIAFALILIGSVGFSQTLTQKESVKKVKSTRVIRPQTIKVETPNGVLIMPIIENKSKTLRVLNSEITSPEKGKSEKVLKQKLNSVEVKNQTSKIN
jgi:hypothetical protein